jgi:hypothetical protein
MVFTAEEQVLVVPPFECAWLTGTGDTPLLQDQGCVCFEVKGEKARGVPTRNRRARPPAAAPLPTSSPSSPWRPPLRTGDNDVTVIFKSQCGSRRWQHLRSRVPPAGGDPGGRASPVEANYTVILGSHRNSRLKFEKDGELCHSVANAPGSRLSSTSFTKFWINYDRGTLTVGGGEPSASTARHSWTDPDPIPDIRFAGLSAWDKHVGYRNIRVQPAVDFSQQPAPAAAAAAAAAGAAPGPAPTLVELCCREALRTLSTGSVCAVLDAADAIAPVIDGLRAHAVEFAARHLVDVRADHPAGFCALSADSMTDILRSQSLVFPEKQVYDALMAWAAAGTSGALPAGDAKPTAPPSHPGGMDADGGPPTPPGEAAVCSPRPSSRPPRDRHLSALLPLIRFPLMTDEELEQVAAEPACAPASLLRELLAEAAEARRGGGTARGAASVRAPRLVQEHSASEAAASARFQRRRPPGCTELIYMFDGDHNGACWHVATRYGTRQWVNPVSAGLVAARASSPACRGTDPRALLSGGFLRTNFAGPRREGGALSTWWQLDFGAGHALECNYYTLRHDGSTDFLRSWALQGSADGAAWADLRRHADDRTLKLPGQYASWPVSGPAAARPYRFFRILLLAPNAEAANPRHACLSYIELYGNFYTAAAAAAAAAVPRDE